MSKNMMWFAIGIIVGTLGLTVLSASSGFRSESGSGWTERDVARAIGLLETIAANTAR